MTRSMLLANVIFPAPSAAYFATIFFPLAGVLALTTEFAVFARFQRGVMSRFRILGVVVVVNLFSWSVGLALSFFLPSGLVPKLADAGDRQVSIITQGPHWGTLAILSFFWACLLSIALEYAALRLLRRRRPLENAALCVGLANVASYCVIGAVASVYLYFDLF
jgi:hypothetical protein